LLFLSLRHPLSSCYWFSKIQLEELLKVIHHRWRLLTFSSTGTAFKNTRKFNNSKTWKYETLPNPFLLLHHLLVYYLILLCRVLVIRLLVGLNFPSSFFLAPRKYPFFDRFRTFEFCKFYLLCFTTLISLTSAQSVVKSPSAVHRSTTTKPIPRSRFKQPINFIKKPAQGLCRKEEEEENSVEVRGDYSTSCWYCTFMRIRIRKEAYRVLLGLPT
jgi:hypothetical protein